MSQSHKELVSSKFLQGHKMLIYILTFISLHIAISIMPFKKKASLILAEQAMIFATSFMSQFSSVSPINWTPLLIQKLFSTQSKHFSYPRVTRKGGGAHKVVMLLTLFTCFNCLNYFYCFRSDHCPILSVSKSVTALVETWLMWPWRVKITQPLIALLCRILSNRTSCWRLVQLLLYVFLALYQTKLSWSLTKITKLIDWLKHSKSLQAHVLGPLCLAFDIV